jgi:hypothetical protein
MPWDTMDPEQPCKTCVRGIWQSDDRMARVMVDQFCGECSHHNPKAKALQWSPEHATCNGCGAELTAQGYDYEPMAPVTAADATLCARCVHNTLKKLDDLRKRLGAGDEWWAELGTDGNKRNSPLNRLVKR